MSNEKSNRMETMPVKKLMLSMGIPMILSMMLQAVYNIVDSAFVSNMKGTGEAALNALTLAFPVQMFMVAIGIGSGVGVNVLVAQSLGEKNRERASRTTGNAIFLGIVIYALCLLFGIFGVNAYVKSQTANIQIVEMACSYLRICCIASFGIVFFPFFEKILQATGRPLYSTIAQVTGAVLNIVLDPIMIYGLLGCPKLGVNGAAYATVIGQIASFVLAFIFHLKYNKEITNKLAYIRPDKGIIKRIYSIGVPAIIAQALMSVMTYALNIIFGGIQERIVTAYGLYYKIQQFLLFAAFGLRDAITPIVSFNYGKGDKTRIREGIRCGILFTLAIMAVGMVILEVFAQPLSGVFGLSGKTAALCISAIHIISLSFLFAGANIAIQGCFQALNGGGETFIISVCRQFVFVIPVAWFFARLVKKGAAPTGLLWTTFIIAEGISLLLAIIMLKRILRKKVDNL